MLREATVLPFDHPKLDDRILWDYAAKTYLIWFDQGSEDFPAEEEELRDYYGKADDLDIWVMADAFQRSSPNRLSMRPRRLRLNLQG
jgi:hypothetical protein